VKLQGQTGLLFVEDAANGRDASSAAKTYLNVELSPSLLPVLMPLLARLRHLFDLDAEPTAVDAHLEQSGLAELVKHRPGVRMAGAFDGFEVALALLLRETNGSSAARDDLVRRVVADLGEPFETGVPVLNRLAPTVERVAEAGASRLRALGVSSRHADAISSVARAVAIGRLRLEPGGDAIETRRALMQIGDIGDRLATTIVMRALYWPDAFPTSDRALQRAAGARSPRDLRARAEKWRPWRAYAALHLCLSSAECSPR
jgi:AraC family transcriptional regulator of adaptative response / DNA-3-methyladenine glycosylase II